MLCNTEIKNFKKPLECKLSKLSKKISDFTGKVGHSFEWVSDLKDVI